MPDLRESVVLTSEMFSPDHFTIVTSFMNNWTASFSPISSVPRTRSPTLSAVTRLWHTSVVTAPLRMLPRTRPSSHTCYACFSTILVNALVLAKITTSARGGTRPSRRTANLELVSSLSSTKGLGAVRDIASFDDELICFRAKRSRRSHTSCRTSASSSYVLTLIESFAHELIPQGPSPRWTTRIAKIPMRCEGLDNMRRVSDRWETVPTC